MHIAKEDWPRVSALLDEALALEAPARAVWLDGLAPADAGLRPALERLLSREAGEQFASATLSQFGGSPPEDGLRAGQVVGGYRLQQLLGQGGMGAVWLAERVGTSFKRRVALKLLHSTLVGASFVERFHRERDILASLTYPDIARLYDAGVTETGRPFLALEYVNGIPINRYCDDNRLPIAARLRLFQRVLDAVQHAHGELVVHRDIKPSNIFVTGKGEVHLLDFGIARFAEDAPVEATELTRAGGRLLTPEYASPEQIADKPVGIASDVYSLGVVLYELLAGCRPYRVRRASLGALEDAVLSGDFVMASEATVSADAADRRAVALRRLRQLLAGDLDAILARALRTDPRQRYPTCEAFGRDIGRFLSGEAVLARRGSTLYRVTKFVRRNRVATGAVATVFAAITVGAGVALWQAAVAQQNEARANTEAARAERERAVAVAVTEFLVDVFRVNDPDATAYAAPGSRSAREVLGEGIARLRGAFDDQPEVRTELYDAIIDILDNLGDLDQALELAREAVAYAEVKFGRRHERYAAAVLREAIVRRDLEQVDEARRLAAVVESVLDASGDRSSALRGRVLVFVGTRLWRAGPEGLKDAEQAKHGIALLAMNDVAAATRAQALLELAFAYGELGQTQSALDALDAALAWTQGFEGALRLRSQALGLRAALVASLGRRDEAEASLREAVEVVAGLPSGHPVALRMMLHLGTFLHMHGRRPEGRIWLARSEQGMRQAFRSDSLAADNARLASLHAAVMDGAVEDVRRALPALLPHVADEARPPSVRMETGWVALRWHIRAKEPGRAEAMLSLLGPLVTDPGSPEAVRLYLARARVALLRGSAGQAREWASRVRDVEPEIGVGAPAAPDSNAALPASIRHEHLLIASEIAQLERRFADAIELARRAGHASDTPTLEPYAEENAAEDSRRLGEARMAAGDAAGAREPLARAVAIYALEHHPSSPVLAAARAALARCDVALARKARRESAPGDRLLRRTSMVPNA
jgi:serine/threonine-protein kinase